MNGTNLTLRVLVLFGACLAFVSSCAPGAPGPTKGVGAVPATETSSGGTTSMTTDIVSPPGSSSTPGAAVQRLPAPRETGTMSVEEALARRRSIREFRPDALDDATVGQLLWAAQGITDPAGHRTAPSAGALYPLELYVASARGVHWYRPEIHGLELVGRADRRPDLGLAALGQEVVASAPLIIVITAVLERTAARYGDRAERYVALEAGHAAQDVLLQATALGLGAVPVGAFDDSTVRRVLELPGDRLPLYLIPVGRPR